MGLFKRSGKTKSKRSGKTESKRSGETESKRSGKISRKRSEKNSKKRSEKNERIGSSAPPEYLLFEPLEPRILLSADAIGGSFDAHDADFAAHILQSPDDLRASLELKLLHKLDSLAPLGTPGAKFSTSVDHTPILKSLDLDALGLFMADPLTADAAPLRTEIIIVDSDVPDAAQLLAQLQQNSAVQYQIHFLEPGSGGVEQVSAILAQHQAVAAVHILSHGGAGELHLAGDVLSQDSVGQYEDALRQWQDSLTGSADILLYGCELAGNTAGQSLLATLAQWTAADIAASDDKTGAADFGGDWHLEYRTGAVESMLSLAGAIDTQWQHTLATITVTSNGDAGLAVGVDSVVELLATGDPITLRQAISVVNADFYSGDTTVHTIEFDLQGNYNIALAMALPDIDAAVVIDGTSEAAYTDTPLVTLTGSSALLSLDGDNITVRGLVLQGSSSDGMRILGDNNIVVGNRILGNAGDGISISGSGNQIGGIAAPLRNVISANGGDGISISGFDANANRVQGNYIGVSDTGAAANGNAGNGVIIAAGADNNMIGGAVAGAGNIISANGGDGIFISGDGTAVSSGNIVTGNIIGLNAAGADILANAGNGVEVFDTSANTIGGASAAERNIISGNSQHGVYISGNDSFANVVSGNYIGTDLTGSSALGNQLYGVRLEGLDTGAADNTRIGGLGMGQGNVISGNSSGGIYLGAGAYHVDILGNDIGVAADDTTSLGNNGNGITVKTGINGAGFVPSDILIQGNTVAYNSGIGVAVENLYTFNVQIVENRIFANTDLGIDLGANGVTANDPGDSDVGVNAQSNYPVINSISVVGGQLRIVGGLDNAQETSPLTIHFYYASASHTSNHGGAEDYIGSVTLAPGTANFDQLFDTMVPDDSYVTATATGSLGTSEFSTNYYLVTGNLVNIDPVGMPSISGALIQGALLTATHTITDGNGRSGPVNYQWQRNGIDISGATADTYTLVEADVGSDITVVVRYIDDDGFAETISSGNYGPVANVNDAPVGAVTISGSVVEDQTLSAVLTFTDEDGLPGTISYQWYNNGVAVNGATGADYVLTQLDVGCKITVRVSYQDLQGTDETLLSAETATVLNINDPPTGTLAITGSATEGQTLNANLGFSDGDGLTGVFAIQWYRDGVAIADATGIQYGLVQADVGTRISVDVTYTDAHGTVENIASTPTAVVENINDSPVGNLLITGDAREGETLIIYQDITDEDGMPALMNYQWYRDSVAIDGATGNSYAVTQDDVGSRISVRLHYTDNFGYLENFASAPTAPVANANNPPVGAATITGVAAEGEILTANAMFTDADGVPSLLNYQWLRDGAPIAGASGASYALVQADVGHTIRVAITYTDNEGTGENLTSDATAAVINRNNPPAGTVNMVGSFVENQVVAAEPAFTDQDGLPGTFAYQWYRDGQLLIGENAATYQLQQDDVGTRIHVEMTYRDNYGTAETVSSAVSAPVANLNELPTGALNIAGVAMENQRLIAVHAFNDADGLPDVFSYQWYRDGVAIGGASGGEYILADADVGSRISVAVFYTDGYGQAETVISGATAPILAVNDAPSGALTIVGNPVERDILTANSSVTDADGISGNVIWQWYRDGIPIANANTANYQLTATDIDAVISVGMTYTDDQGYDESVMSAVTGPVAAFNYLPQGELVISGNPSPGEILTLTGNITDGNGIPGEIQYVWQRDGEPITGFTGSQYLVTEADRGTTISVLASYVDARGFEEAVLSNLVEIPTFPLPLPTGETAAPAAEPIVPAAPAELPNGSVSATETAETEPESANPQLQIREEPVYVSAGNDQPGMRDESIFNDGGTFAASDNFFNFSGLNNTTLHNRLENAAAVLAVSAEKVLTGSALSSVFPSLHESIALLNNNQYSSDVSRAVQDIKDSHNSLTVAIVGGTAAVSTGLSVGYVIWTLRSGILMTGLLSSLPAWRFIDPLPILSGKASDDVDDDNETLESLVTDNRNARSNEHAAPTGAQ